MKNSILIILFLIVLQHTFAQTTITGTVTTNKKETVPGANIILQDTYDGTTSDIDGNFTFTTTETGKQILLVTFVGYITFSDTLQLNGETIQIQVNLKEQFNELNAVVVTAGAFEASDEKKAAVLRPLDIVTTAGAEGDIYGALETLPGATQVGNDDGLYVRGGSDYETKTIIDGLPVQNPYYSTVPDVPSRGRFAPFLFKGTVFSTGGYSAEYGQALSSAVILETEEFPEYSSSGFSIAPIFLGGYHVQKFKNDRTALGGGINYTNIGLYDEIFKPRTYEVLESIEAADANMYFRQKLGDNGILKFYGQFETSSDFGLRFPDVDSLAEGVTDDVHLKSNYQYANVSYKQILGDSWTMYLAAGFSNSDDSTVFDGLNVSNGDDALQTKATFKNQLTEKVSMKFGGEYQKTNNKQFNPFVLEYEKVQENYSAVFAESDIFITNDLAGRIGLRSEYSQLLDAVNLAPRISLAYKTGKNSQVSFAYGDFYQTPQPEYLYNTYPYFTAPSALGYEKATHYIANYQVLTNDRTFRIEAYYKKYDDLITEEYGIDPALFLGNSGTGYAKGIDVFFRDKKTFENIDYWVSYSFLDTKRKFLNYPIETQPTFAAEHVASVVYKQYVPAIRTQFGATYRFISGFPYYDPFAAEEDFLANTSPAYHNFSLNASYLTSIFENFTVIFVSFDNVFGFDQIYGYTYSTEDAGMFLEQRPPLKSSVFIGLFMNILKQADREQIQEAIDAEE